MHPVLFRWGKFTVHSYPVMLYLGLLGGILAGNWAASSAGLDVFRVDLVSILLCIPTIIGARLLHTFSHNQNGRGNWKRMWQRGAGGAALYGGLLLSVPLAFPLLRALRVPKGAYGDAVIFTMLIAMAFGRIGCVLHGCCAGRTSQSFLAINLPNLKGAWKKRIPTQYLEATLSLLLAAAAVLVRTSLPFRGALFLLMVAGYAIGRIALESTREETSKGQFTIHHGISVMLILCCLGALAVQWHR